jgi:hypothetical protein
MVLWLYARLSVEPKIGRVSGVLGRVTSRPGVLRPLNACPFILPSNIFNSPQSH